MEPAAGTPTERRVLPNFRRTTRFLRAHLRPLVIGLFMAVGVSLFYTFSISSVVPLLKVMFADHETLVDWLHRAETQRRLEVAIAGDLPDNPAGLEIDHVRPAGINGGVLKPGDRIAAIGGSTGSSYEILARISQERSVRLPEVTLRSPDGAERSAALQLAPYRWYSAALETLAGWIPSGKSADARLTQLGFVMLCLILASLFGGLCRFANEGLVNIAVQRTMHDIRTTLADHVLRLPVHWHAAQSQGDTLGRFATDIAKVEVGLSTIFGKVIAEPLKAVGVLALTLVIDWRLLVVALIGLPIGAIMIRTFGKMVKRAQKRASASWGRLLDHLGERLDGIRVVKAYNMEVAESRRFEREDRNLTRAQTHIELVDAATNPALEFLAMCAVAMFVMYGGTRVFAGDLEPNLFFAAVVCLVGMMDPVRKMGNVNNRLQAAEASAARIWELIDLPIEEPHARSGAVRPLPRLERAIAFEAVSFAYPSKPRKLVLREVSARIEKGQVVAIVGPNGSGKTSLMALLLRFYEPTSGRILVDDMDIADATLESLRGQIGLVTQDSVIFSDTLRDNLGYGEESTTPEQLDHAVATAHISDFVSNLHSEADGAVQHGYAARISARSLSGGQKQRIALARAILRDPPILVLDEATSQVDSESERKIQEALEDVVRGRTVFIIAHRYSTIARADVIMVLDEGRLVGFGRHDELLESSPFYAALCRTQFAHAG